MLKSPGVFCQTEGARLFKLKELVYLIRITVSVYLIAAALILAGCGAMGQTEPGLLDQGGYQQEFLEAKAQLELPPGFKFPGEVPDTGGAWVEEGGGVAHAQSYWEHVWTTEWLEQRGKDEARAEKALHMLKYVIPEGEFMREKLDQAGRDLHAENVRKAELGDPSGFQHFVTVNPMSLYRTADEQ